MATLLSTDDLADRLATLGGWSGDTTAIRRSVELPTFVAAIDVVNQVAQVAEGMDHHPDIDIRWRTLRFACTTHSAGGVTELDVELARHINDIVATATG